MALKLSRNTELAPSTDVDVAIEEHILGFNPFPGLRPFTFEESHLFFGREGQVDEILVKLAKHRSVAVLGSSGSGKSSLIYCGLVPVLYGGFMTETGPNWHVVNSRPGISPIANLASSVVDFMIARGYANEADRDIQLAVINSVLKNSTNGLVEVARHLQIRGSENICFLLDQFEEIFRFKATSEDAYDEALHYVNLVLSAIKQQAVPAYIAVSMRSDFLSESGEFQGLTEILNQSNFVVPRMTRDQKRTAIEGPIAVAGGTISRRLIKRLLADLEEQQDALPIMQHALMRTWDYWIKNREAGEPLDLRHYNAVGRIEQALSQHANEAYDELNTRDKEIAEVVFKNITEKNQDNQGTRRPGRISEMAELANATPEEVIRVVDQFRKPGRSFLMPGINSPLNQESLIEISHESMMRIWTRLSSWVGDEFESSQMYKRLSEASAMYQIGRTGLWRPPDLQLALNWQKKQNPTRTWAQRYDEAFERAIVFLDTSRITYEAELKNQEMLQKRMLRRARVTNIILGLAFIVAMVFFLFGLTQRIEAENKAEIAEVKEKEAIAAKAVAEKQTKEAQLAKTQIEEQTEKLSISLKELEAAYRDTELAREEAEENLKKAVAQEKIANNARTQETAQRIKAEKAQQEAVENFNRANSLLMLTIAQSMEAKAETMEDGQLSGLLALQGYNFHTKFGGKKSDPYVFRGLYYANAKLRGYNYNAAQVPGNLRNRMIGLAVSPSTNKFYVTGTDGRVYAGNTQKISASEKLLENNYPNRVVAVSPDEKYLVVGSDSSIIQVLKLEGSSKPALVPGHRGAVNDVKFLPDNAGFISVAMDNAVRLTNHLAMTSKTIANLPFSLKAISINKAGTQLVGVATTGQVIMMDLKTYAYNIIRNEAPNRVLSVAFHPSGTKIAYGMEIIGSNQQVVRGLVKSIDLVANRIKELGGHKSGVSDVEFSPDGLLLATASLDKKLQLWVVDKEEDLPVVMDNNNGNIWNIGFTKASDYLIATCNNGEIRIWPTDPRVLADYLCPNLKRPLTQEEWSIYVGEEIPYEKSCDN
jgi:multidrug efflux pump subunit AcrA (membrane-fusion protein)/energy-coupling factor transporter ATP-binding protein EcfA2